MRVLLLDDPAVFLDRAGSLLLEDEARHNLALGLLGTLRDHPWRYPERWLWVVEDGGDVVGGALRTPPHGIVILRPAAEGALDALAAAIDQELPGAVGAIPEVEDFAQAWASRRGVSTRTKFRQRIFALREVIPAQPCPGAPRVADERDSDLLIGWLHEFAVEALHEKDPDRSSLEANVEHKLLAEDAAYVLWEVGGEPVSATGYGSSTPNGIRIGPVYTPPEHRGRGYASALVAHVSADRLAAGRRFCFLYTDLENPTSNKIYSDLGYEPVCDSLQIEFS